MRKDKILLQDISVILICLIGAIFFFYLFYTDINRTLSRINAEPIGIITFRYNTAQRRFIDRLIWDRLKNESPVYNGDVIRTADISEATITFEHGEIIDLFSNTIVQIFIEADGSGRIDLAQGGININSYISSEVSSNRTFTIIQGSQTVTVESGEAIFVSTVSEDETAPHAVPVSPSGNARFLTQRAQSINIDFSWSLTNNYSGETKLEIAGDRNFNRILFSEDFAGTHCSLAVPQGEWFWRVRPVSEASLPAANTSSNIQYSKLTIVSASAPSLLNPLEGQVINYQSKSPLTRFQWTASALAQSYTLEVADNPLMNNPALVVQVRGAGNIISYNTTALNHGTWYWRVTPIYSRDFNQSAAQSTELSSAVHSFKIEQDVNLPSPVLISPAPGAVLNIETGRRDIFFTWKKEIEALAYTIKISNNRDMSSPVIEQTVTEPFYRYESEETSLTPGEFYWTVSQTSQEGIASSAGEIRSFNAMQGIIEQRQVFPPDTYRIAESLLPFTRFTWKTNLSNTRFQVSDNENFTNIIIDDNAVNESYTIRFLRTGTYYWRITGSTGNQRQESPPRRFTVVPSLHEPNLIKPESIAFVRDGSIVVEEDQPLEFRWHQVEGAEYYMFRLLKGNRTVDEVMVTGFSYTVNMGRYGDGLFTWEVQGFAREHALSTRIPGLTADQNINIIYLKPVTLANPYNGMEYTGINASRNPDTLQWSSPVPPVGVQVIIARNEDISDIVFRRYSAPFSFIMPRLTQGEYFWTVRAQTEEGLDISAISPSRFTVTPIPPLPAPLNLRPADRFTVTVPMLRQSRSLEFSWDRVQGANGYILTVFQGSRANKETILETEVLTVTNYKIEDARILGRGDFTWQVEAVYVYAGDFIEQRGNVREQRLIMNIPAPTKIETNETGELYAR